MKKVSSKDIQWQKILYNKNKKVGKKSHRKKKLAKARNRVNRGARNRVNRGARNRVNRRLTDRGTCKESLNHDIDIYSEDNRKTLSRICQNIRDFQGKEIHLSFGGGIKISATGMLWLYAEICRKVDEGKAKITCDYPADRKVEQILQHIGFFKKIGKSERISDDEIRNADKDVHSWHALGGSTDDLEDPATTIEEFLEKVTDSITIDVSKINIAIKELIANVMEHAYDENDALKPWVIFGRAEEEKYLTIVVGDLGKTIPATMKEHSTITEIRTRKEIVALKKIMATDSSLIKHATELTGTRTLKKYRGKGLKDAIKNIGTLKGDLAIYSRKGLYKPYLLSRQEKRKKWKKMVIHGTIVEMVIPLKFRGLES